MWGADDWDRIPMAGGEQIVIARLSPIGTGLFFLGVSAFLGLILWMALVHGYYAPRRDGLQFGLGPLLPLLIPLGVLLWLGVLRVISVLFRGAAALCIQDDALVELVDQRRRIPLSEISRIGVGPDTVFVGIAASFVVERKGGRRSWFGSAYREPAEAIVIALKAELKRRGHEIGPITHINDADAPPEGG